MALTKVTGKGLETLSDGVTITVTDTSDVLTLVSTDAGAGSGPGLDLYRNSSSGASGDGAGKIGFHAEDANSDKIRLVAMFATMTDATNGSEDGSFHISTMTAGTERDKLHIYPTETVFNEDSQDQDFRIESNGNANMLFVDGGNDGVVIGSGGKGPALGGLNSSLQIIGSSQDNSSMGLIATTNDADGANIVAGKGRSTNGGQGTIAADDDRVLNIRAAIDDGTNFAHEVGNIEFAVDGTPGANDTPGRIVFSTTADGASSPTERMRITSFGQFVMPGVYNDTTSDAANVNVRSDGLHRRNTSSLRYKNTVNNATHGLTELLALRPVTYKGNNDGDTVFGGLIAEEVHDAGLTEFVDYDSENRPDALRYPHMVSLCIKAIQELSEKNDALESRLIDQSKLVPLLVKTIQELEARITALEA